MTYATINDCYRAFAELFGTERPQWTRNQLQDWIQARGLRYEQVTDELLGEAYDQASTSGDEPTSF